MTERTTRNHVMHSTNPGRLRAWLCAVPGGKCPVLLMIRFYEWLHGKFFRFVYPNNSKLTEEEKARIEELAKKERRFRQKVRESRKKEP